jgi:hypothetical protein
LRRSAQLPKISEPKTTETEENMEKFWKVNGQWSLLNDQNDG